MCCPSIACGTANRMQLAMHLATRSFTAGTHYVALKSYRQIAANATNLQPDQIQLTNENHITTNPRRRARWRTDPNRRPRAGRAKDEDDDRYSVVYHDAGRGAD